MRVLHLQFLLKLTGGAIIMAPLLAWGHACEYLVARMETEGARIRLEITADYGANPLIADEAEALHAIRSILQVLPPAGSPKSLEELAPLKLEHRSAWDPEAPASLSPPPDGQPHQLLTGLWEWQSPHPAIRLAVPKGHHHDVLLWKKEPGLSGQNQAPKWMLLIAGESSPELSLAQPAPPPVPSSSPWAAGLCLGTATLLCAGAVLWRRRSSGT